MKPFSAPRHFVLLAAICIAGCAFVPNLTVEELRALDSPPDPVRDRVDRLLPRALAWYSAVETELLLKGRPLTDQEKSVAQSLGVGDPSKVRVIILDRFPMPTDPELLAEAERHGMGSRFEGGRTIGYAIMLKPWIAQDSTVLNHELVHVAQHDRMGRSGFVRRYLIELSLVGYARSPLELEAYAKQKRAQ